MNEIAAASPMRATRGTCCAEKIGKSCSIAATRAKTRMNVSNCAALSPKTSTTASVGGVRDARYHPGREIGEHREHERPEEQDGQRGDDDLRYEGQRGLLNLSDGLQQGDDHSRHKADDQNRSSDDQ